MSQPTSLLTSSPSPARLRVRAALRPLAESGWFQPTGFPDLGMALYNAPDGRACCLVESPQSVANHLETSCFQNGSYVGPCVGIGHIRVVAADGTYLASSVDESHRLASAYIREAKGAPNWMAELGLKPEQPFRRQDVAARLFTIDPGCLLHGIWFNAKELNGGKVRFSRAISGEVTAFDVSAADYGFQRRDNVSDRTDAEEGKSAVEGYGSVIGAKRRLVAREIVASFVVDVALLDSYFPRGDDGAPDPRTAFLTDWALYKIRRFLDHGLKLRSECDLLATDVRGATYPGAGTFELPSELELAERVRDHVEHHRSIWKERTVTWQGAKGKKPKTQPAAEPTSES